MGEIRFISPAALAAADSMTVVDVRDYTDYREVGHVPGAVSLPTDRFRDPTGFGPGMLPDPDSFREWLGAVGIEREDDVVAYDDDHGSNAARLLLTLAAFGHEGDLYLLDGDYSVWERDHEVSTRDPDPASTTYDGGDFETELIADRETVEAAVHSETAILDTRTEAEYEQAHVPGAIQVSWERFVGEDGRVRPEPELRSVFEGLGLDPGNRIVLYCNTARRLSYVYAVLSQLGYEDVRFYEGSLRDWIQAESPSWDPAEIKTRVSEHADEGLDAVKEALGEDAAAKMKLVGLYEQKQGAYLMFRTKIPGGVLPAEAARALGEIADEYARAPESYGGTEQNPMFGDGYLDITTRQDVQLHWIEIEDVPEIWDRLDSVGVSTFQTGGNSVRNVVACPVAGLAPDEVVDARPVAEAVTEAFLADRRYANLPRKLKVSVNGCRGACAQPEINDLGFTPARKGDRVGFNLAAGGGLGDSPRIASDLDVFVEPDEVVDVVRATADLFIEHGSYLDTAVNRLRFLVEEWGVERFRDELERFAPFVFESGGEDLVEHHHADHVGIREQADGDSYVGLNVPVGRMSGTEFAELAGLAEEYGSSELRLTPKQNAIVVGVPNDRLDALGDEELLDTYSPDPGPFSRGVVTCTGREYCNYALIETKMRARRWAETLDERIDIDQNRVEFRLSGCTASCAQPQIGDIGMRGETIQTDTGVTQAVDVALGGRLNADPQFAEWVAPRIPIEELPAAIERVVDLYHDRSREGERLFECCQRLPNETLYDALTPAESDARDLRAQP